MPTYVLLLRNNADGAARMLASGAIGAAEQADAIAALGGRMIGQWAVSGRFDEVLVVDLPGEAEAMTLVLGATAAGQYAELLHAHEPDVIQAASTLFTDTAAKLAGPVEPPAEDGA